MTVSTIPSPLLFCILISKSLLWCINSGGRVLEEAQVRAKCNLLQKQRPEKSLVTTSLCSQSAVHKAHWKNSLQRMTIRSLKNMSWEITCCIELDKHINMSIYCKTFFKTELCPDIGDKISCKNFKSNNPFYSFPMIFLEHTDQKLYISALSSILIQVTNNV